MALFGVGLNIDHFMTFLGWSHLLSVLFLTLGWLTFGFLIFHYGFALLTSESRALLKGEWDDPVTLSLFAVLSLTAMLFISSLSVVGVEPSVLIWGFYGMVALHTLYSMSLFSRWFFDEQLDITHLKPSWFIVLSGNFYIVIAGSSLLQGAVRELLWFYFSYSFLVWVFVATFMMHRLFFIAPLKEKARPSLFIFLAPPSLGVIASLQLIETSGQLNFVVWGLYSFATMMLLVWIFSFPVFYQSQLSMLSWAYVYPLAAYGLASQYLMELNGHLLFWGMAISILTLAIGITLLLLVWVLKQLKTSG